MSDNQPTLTTQEDVDEQEEQPLLTTPQGTPNTNTQQEVDEQEEQQLLTTPQGTPDEDDELSDNGEDNKEEEEEGKDSNDKVFGYVTLSARIIKKANNKTKQNNIINRFEARKMVTKFVFAKINDESTASLIHYLLNDNDNIICIFVNELTKMFPNRRQMERNSNIRFFVDTLAQTKPDAWVYGFTRFTVDNIKLMEWYQHRAFCGWLDPSKIGDLEDEFAGLLSDTVPGELCWTAGQFSNYKNNWKKHAQKTASYAAYQPIYCEIDSFCRIIDDTLGELYERAMINKRDGEYDYQLCHMFVLAAAIIHFRGLFFSFFCFFFLLILIYIILYCIFLCFLLILIFSF